MAPSQPSQTDKVCSGCGEEGLECHQDRSGDYDADGDGKVEEWEQGGWYCGPCWASYYGAPHPALAARASAGVMAPACSRHAWPQSRH